MKRVLVFFITGVMLFGFCSAQSVNAQNANNEQRIIGTWVEQGGATWIFDANGNLTITGSGTVSVSAGQYKFAVTDTHLAIMNTSNTLAVCSISISSDGRTLMIQTHHYDRGLCFTKR